MLSSALMAAGAASGGVASVIGQRTANIANKQISRDQMAFQERMANTSWQRGVADMRKAGINPMLAVSQGGASAPQGSSIPMQNELSGLGSSVGSALEAYRLKSTLANIDADTALKTANANQIVAQLPSIKSQSDFNANKFGAANDVVDIFKRLLHYDSNVHTVKSAAPGFIDSATKSFKDWWNTTKSDFNTSYHSALSNVRSRYPNSHFLNNK